MRLIDAEALIKAIEQGEGISWDSHGKDDLCVRKKYIDNAPTVEARPQGEWIELCRGIHVTDYKCSCCGRTVRDDTGYDVSKDYPFCHCGAKMKGGAE